MMVGFFLFFFYDKRALTGMERGMEGWPFQNEACGDTMQTIPDEESEVT